MEVIKKEISNIKIIIIKDGENWLEYSEAINKPFPYWLSAALIDGTRFYRPLGESIFIKVGRGKAKKATLEKLENMKEWAKENVNRDY